MHTEMSIANLGQCKQRFHTGHIPFCVKFNPDEDKQHFFLSGMQNKKILQWDTRSGECVQEYDRHLGSVNCITFFDKNRRFCSTSDDKSIRIWEWFVLQSLNQFLNRCLEYCSARRAALAEQGLNYYFL